MFINGREVHFFLTGGAFKEISELCPDEDISNIRGIFSDKANLSLESMCRMAAAMSLGYEMREAFGKPGYQGAALTYEEAMTLSPFEITEQLMPEVVRAFLEGQKTDIQTEALKKKEIAD